MRNTQENVSEIYKKYIRNFWKDIREKYVINKKLTSKLQVIYQENVCNTPENSDITCNLQVFHVETGGSVKY